MWFQQYNANSWEHRWVCRPRARVETMSRAGSRVRTLQRQISVSNWTPCLSTALPAVRLRYFFVPSFS